MNLKPVFVVLLLALVILAGVPESFAISEYLTSFNTVYGSGTCGTCHVKISGGGARNSYGKLFENQPNYNSDPIAALKAIGAPLTATPTLTPIATFTPAATATPAVTTVTTTTPAAPGFGIVASLVGLFALFLLVKRNNK
jgi:PGF-CTERM protein